MLTFALGTLAKGTLLLALGVLADRLWRRRGPDVRHALLATALIGALFVPLLSTLLPVWRAQVRWLPPAPATRSVPNDSRSDEPGAAATLAQSTSARDTRAATLSSVAAQPSYTVAIVAGLWASGALCVFVFLVFGELAMLRVRRRGRVADAALWTRLVREVAIDVGAPPSVPVLLSPEIAVPLTCGFLRPAVLLPTAADSWPDTRKRIVLVHELSHVRRHDAAIELATWLACAVYWFNPLVWIVARRLRLQRELACDDSVVRTTGDSLAYARQLVDMAAAARVPATRGFAALAMAARGSLEVRVRSLLRAQRAGRVPTGALVRVCVVGGVSVLALSVLHPIRAESRPLVQAPRDTLEWPIGPNQVVAWNGAVEAGDTVSVRAAMGSIDVDSGDAGVVTMQAGRRVGPRGIDADTRVSVMRSGRTTMICSVHFYRGRRVAPCEVNDDWGRGSVDDNDVSFRVSVPPGVHVVLMSGLGDLTTTRTRGDVHALTGNGDASIETNGGVTVEAYTGAIALRLLPNMRAKPIDLRVKHGNIDVTLPPNDGAWLTADVDTGLVFYRGVPQRTKGDLGFVGITGGRRLHVAAQKGVVNIGIQGQ